jgi:hypothetical protein
MKHVSLRQPPKAFLLSANRIRTISQLGPDSSFKKAITALPCAADSAVCSMSLVMVTVSMSSMKCNKEALIKGEPLI